MPKPPFRPVQRTDGYLPIADYGLIGDGMTAALVGRDGAVDWLCLPRFDGHPVLGSLLDARKGGAFRLGVSGLRESRQYYEPDTAVLVTELQGAEGVLQITDALTLAAGADLLEDMAVGRRELLRRAVASRGRIRLMVELETRGGRRPEPAAGGLRLLSSGDEPELHLWSTAPLAGGRTELWLEEGETVFFALRWEGGGRHRAVPPDRALDETALAWRRWMSRFRYEGPQAAMVRRSAITLKLLDHFESGGMVAAPTSSLPENIGGVRNWDYRYVWIRDAAFSVYALHRIGYSQEAAGFLGWILDAIERDGHPRVLYNLDGLRPGPETIDPALEGYRRSAPVRWGNGAVDQLQQDVYGEILDCAWQWAAHFGSIDSPLWDRLRSLVEAAARRWRIPDHGIWEVRTAMRPFTYSAAMCSVALDRGARLARRFGLPGDADAWATEAERIREAIIDEAWSPELNALTEHLGGGGLDASVLALPLRRVVAAEHPRMRATVAAVAERLGAGDGLLYRYLPEESPDGLPGHEGAFLLCSFWLADNLIKQGRLDEGGSLYESLCARANGLGLLPEQIDPSTGDFLGNYPQAFSHIGVISTGINLTREMKRRQ